ncbi:MAG: Gfo/Idh/MocA family oxidoreductase [Bacteroidales bacterium]
MERPINWGIIGTGKIANKFALALKHVPGSCMKAVASREKTKAELFASQHNIEKSYGSYLELAEDKKVEVVYVATPHVFHFENTMMCLHNNKAVLCEKPFAMNLNEVTQMVELARQKNLFLMEALWTRFFPGTLRILEIVNSGAIGDIKYIRSDFGFKGIFDPDGRLFNKALGGGSLLDIGIYPVFISLLLLGVPDEVSSEAIIGPTNVDESVSMVFKYNNGSLASLSSTFMANTPIETDICGTLGMIRIPKPWFMSRGFSLILNDGTKEDFNREFICNGYEYEAIEVNNCLRLGKTESSLMTHDFSLKLIGLLDKVREQSHF